MAQAFLDVTHRHAGFDHVRGVAVAQRVRPDRLAEAGFDHGPAQRALHGGLRHGLVGRGTALPVFAQRREHPRRIPMGLVVRSQQRQGALRHRDQPVFRSLAMSDVNELYVARRYRALADESLPPAAIRRHTSL